MAQRTPMNLGRPARILLVEDNSGDEFLLVDAFERAGMRHDLEVVRDGEAALDRLQEAGKLAASGTPDIILLDLNLPKIDGREVLRTLKADAGLRTIPVLVLSTSTAEEDVQYCYDQHANAYLAKPFDAARYEDVVSAVDAFWFSAATLPGEAPATPRPH